MGRGGDGMYAVLELDGGCDLQHERKRQQRMTPRYKPSALGVCQHRHAHRGPAGPRSGSLSKTATGHFAHFLAAVTSNSPHPGLVVAALCVRGMRGNSEFSSRNISLFWTSQVRRQSLFTRKQNEPTDRTSVSPTPSAPVRASASDSLGKVVQQRRLAAWQRVQRDSYLPSMKLEVEDWAPIVQSGLDHRQSSGQKRRLSQRYVLEVVILDLRIKLKLKLEVRLRRTAGISDRIFVEQCPGGFSVAIWMCARDAIGWVKETTYAIAALNGSFFMTLFTSNASE
ncbi:hypothetical protein SCHPADRAFT_891715 [Schizopora paradoxa]|uniref:Uncharacterized protein n=1 Tax=Schizopora paradoxa TaxID=27342 RepID=A0A0H2RI35_9AGAM|nr:hypothetical protein SCHPADRAFT_891715 [Schizopora paradoxa]